MGSSPQVVDWNSDGRMDIVSGDRNGYFNVFIAGDSDMVGYRMFKLMDSTVLDVGGNSQPAVVDWTGDGMKDLILGTEAGLVRLYVNQTSDSWPMFQQYETLRAGGNPGVPINLYRGNPYVFDLDRDSVLDLICGANDGYVYFYQNIGSNAVPELAAAETLKTLDGTLIKPPGTYYGSRCGFGYWDADTLPDFLLSGYDGTVALFSGAEFTGVEAGTTPGVSRLALRAGPNPTAGRTAIWCEAPASAELVVCDGVGRVVRHLGVVSGRSMQAWDGRGDSGVELNSGVYFCRLTGSGQTASGRVVLSR